MENHFGACIRVYESAPGKVSGSGLLFKLHVILGNKQCKECFHDCSRIESARAMYISFQCQPDCLSLGMRMVVVYTNVLTMQNALCPIVASHQCL